MIHFGFEWDPRRAASNFRRHHVSFEEAQTVFYDDDAIQIPDPDHSRNEERFIMLGMSASLRILVVCHCYRKSDSVIRIISARKATKLERSQYEEKR
jgi:uncharacterized DUF497 family protein